MEQYLLNVQHSNGGCVTLTIKRVEPVNHYQFSKWKDLEGHSQLDTVIAYLEDDNYGYIVKEHFENGEPFC